MKPRCRCRPVKSPDATIGPTCGNTASRAGRSCSTFKWAGGAKARKGSSPAFAARCNATATRPMTNWAKASIFAGCLAHARRGFVEANKLAPQNPLPLEIVASHRPALRGGRKSPASGPGAADRHSPAPGTERAGHGGVESAAGGNPPDKSRPEANWPKRAITP